MTAGPTVRSRSEWATIAALLALGLCLFVPWHPLVVTSAYEYSLHLAAVHGWQFGTEVVGTYGPLGFLALPLFHPDTFVRLIAANVVVFVLAALFVHRYWTAVGGSGPASTLWIVLTIVLPAFMSTHVYSPALYVPFVLATVFVVPDFILRTASFDPVRLASVVLLAAFSLVKPTLTPLVGVAVAVVGVDEVVSRRRFPWAVPLFAMAFLLLWVASGQGLAHLAPYLESAAEIAVGYKDGMSYGTRRGDALALVFVAASMVQLAVFTRAMWSRLGWRALGPAATSALTLFIVFQHGFVRADEPHVQPACLTLVALGLLLIPLLTQGPEGRTALALVVAANALVVVACWRLGYGSPAIRVVVDQPRALWSLVAHGTAPLGREAARAADELRLTNPLPRLKEPVDASGVDMGLADAHHLAASIRPTGVMYDAFTPRLSRRNREYIEKASGPATMLLQQDVSPAGRYPTVTDSLSLLGLRSHFEVAGRTGAFLILQRRARPLRLDLVPLATQIAQIDQAIAVPDHGSDPLWTQIDMQPTLAGWLFGIAYKPAPAFITVDAGAGTSTYQLTTAMARAGMILSPLVGTLADWAWLMGAPDGLEPPRVRSFQLGRSPGMAWTYRDRARITFFRLVVTNAP